jgi:hypothetical protein
MKCAYGTGMSEPCCRQSSGRTQVRIRFSGDQPEAASASKVAFHDNDRPFGTARSSFLDWGATSRARAEMILWCRQEKGNGCGSRHIRPGVLIHRARSDVAAFMFDPANDLAWTGGITASTPAQPGSLVAGASVERTARFLGPHVRLRVPGHRL